MKNLSLFFLLFFFSVNVFSQEKVLTFNASDAASTIDKIIATNRVTGQSITVLKTNELDLNSISTGINTVIGREENLLAYPNPFNGETTVLFNSTKNEKIKIILSNTMGQITASAICKLSVGMNKFRISSQLVGINYITVVSDKKKRTCKLVCLSENKSANNIEYIGFAGLGNIEKSSEVESADLIHFEIISGNYTTILMDAPSESKTYDVEFLSCADNAGRNYKVVKMGNQWWMAENLAYLPEVDLPADGSFNKPFYYVYDYEGTNKSEAKATAEFESYGVLYNWEAATSSCPNGWHLPTDIEWEQLATFINVDNGSNYTKVIEFEYKDWWTNIGGHLKSISNWTKNGIDNYGFNGRPSGLRTHSGRFAKKESHAFWWSATDYYNSSWSRELHDEDSNFYRVRYDKTEGFCIRCIKD